MIEDNNKFVDLTVGIKWDDMRAPASSINPQGQASPPIVDNDDGGLVFRKGDITAIWFQIPHGWLEQSTIYPHLHWVKPTDEPGIPNWQMKYKMAKPHEVFPEFTDLISGSEGIPTNDIINKHSIYSFPSIDMTGQTLSTMICVVLQRTNDVNDTYAGDAKLLEFDIHYQIDDGKGSKSPFEK